jgi:hypothetical protein
MIICLEVIAQLDNAQENRSLTDDEIQLKKLLKSRILGLATIEQSIAQQQSRLTWIRKGDTNTRYFHIIASTRKKNNFLVVLSNDTDVVTSQSNKHQVIFSTFKIILDQTQNGNTPLTMQNSDGGRNNSAT